MLKIRMLIFAFLVIASVLVTFGICGLVFAAIVLAIAAAFWIARFSGATFLTVVFLLIALLRCGVFIRSPDAPSPVCRSNWCQDHLRTIGVGLQTYLRARKHFPPPNLSDPEGKLVTSWRLAILPFMEERPVYDEYDLKEPWNGTKNSKLSQNFDLFFCTEDCHHGPGETSYVAMTGPTTVWASEEEISLKDIPDGGENTIAVIEMHKSGIQTLEPRDFSLEQWTPENQEWILEKIAPHRYRERWYYKEQDYGNVLYADGHVAVLSKKLLAKYLPALCSRNGGEKIDLDASLSPEFDWALLLPLLGLTFSVVVVLCSPGRKKEPKS